MTDGLNAGPAPESLSDILLSRLARLLVLDRLAASPAERVLVRRATFATWLECREAGLLDAARALIALSITFGISLQGAAHHGLSNASL